MRQSDAANAIIAGLSRRDAPGGVAGVVVNGEMVWRGAFGLADLSTGAVFAPDTRFHVCSITKTFTALLLGLLEADGALSMDDPLRRHLPSTPDYDTPLTLRHLVTNSSGLRDYFPLMWLEAGRMVGAYPREPMERHALAQPTLMFPPGSRYSYSNSNFVALCRVMESLTGQTYATLARERILEPLGMARSEFRTQTIPEPAESALGYFEDGDGGFRAPRLDVHEAGDGGLWSTLDDMARYGAALASGAFGPPDLIARLTAPTLLTSGHSSWYGSGFGTGERGGARWFGHAGGLAGMSTNLACFPDHKAAVITAFNGPAGDAEELGFRLADIFLDLRPAPRPHAGKTLPATDWAGCWQDERAGLTAEISVNGERGELTQFGWTVPLSATTPDVLEDPESATIVRRLGKDSLSLAAGRGAPVTLTRRPAGAARAPTGVFQGLEVETRLEIRDEGAVLYGRDGPSPVYPLKAAARDVWTLLRPEGGRAGVVITRTPDGSLLVSMAKAERILFRRLP
ncbi:MAG TPA: serine hydrolase [Caulobacter sp.]|nr:serine hydrolase [Caulobacter sp.]